MDERDKKPIAPASGRLTALYAAVVVGLSAFLTLAILFPQPIESYRAGVTIEQSIDEGEASLDLPLITPARVDRVARELFAAEPATAERAYLEAVQFQVDRLTPQRARLVLETTDRYADQGLALCERIASAIVERQANSYVPGLEERRSQRSDVDRRLLLVRDTLRSLEEEQTSLQREHLAEFSAALQRVVAAQASNAPSEATPWNLPKEYYRLEAEFNGLLVKRRELTRNRTDEHPEVRDLDDRLAAAKTRLDQLTPAIQSAAQSQGTATAATQNALAQLEQLQLDFQRRTRETSDALVSARRREQDLTAEVARLAVMPGAVAIATSVVDPPRVLSRAGGDLSTMRLTGFIALSLAAAALVYGLVRRHLAVKTLRSAADISAELGMPVVSLVPPQSVVAPSRLEALLSRSVLIAEILLMIVAFSMLSLVSAQSQLTQPAASDPFGAIAESLDRSFSPVVRR